MFPIESSIIYTMKKLFSEKYCFGITLACNQSLNHNAFVKNHKSVSNHEFLFLLLSLSIVLKIFSSNLSFMFKFEYFSLRMLSRLQLCAMAWTAAHQLLCPWNFPGKNTEMGCHFPLQGIYLTQR